MWAACRPDSTPERTKRFRFGGSEDRVSISRKRKGLRSSAGKRDNRHPWVMSRVQAKSRWQVAERNPHQRSKANSALTSVAPFDCTHGVAAPRADIKQQCEVSLCIEWILRGACEALSNLALQLPLRRSARAVQRRAASKIN